MEPPADWDIKEPDADSSIKTGPKQKGGANKWVSSDNFDWCLYGMYSIF